MFDYYLCFLLQSRLSVNNRLVNNSDYQAPSQNDRFAMTRAVIQDEICLNRQATSSVSGARCSSVVRAFARGAMGRRIDPSWSYISFQPVLHDLCNKGRGMCYPVCGMVHIKEPMAVNRKD